MMGEMSDEEEEIATESGKPLDYSLMDNMTGFLYTEDDPLSILCGYFSRIMQELLTKHKTKTLRYLLIE